MKEQYILEEEHDIYGDISINSLEKPRNSLLKEQITGTAIVVDPEHSTRYFMSIAVLELINNSQDLLENTPVQRLEHYESDSDEKECVICGDQDSEVHPYFYHNRMAVHLHIECIEELGEYILQKIEGESSNVLAGLI